MYYLYNDVQIMYPQLVIAAWKAESDQEDHTGECIQVKSAQADGRDDMVKLSEQIAQL